MKTKVEAHLKPRCTIFPNLFIVGAAKAGTTSVYYYLAEHPAVYMSPVKEPLFFNDTVPEEKKITSWDEYYDLFKEVKKELVIGEASPSYLYYPVTPQKIYSVQPKAKIIIILRNPVERAYSHYLMDFNGGLNNKTFHESILEDMVDLGQVKCWGRDHMYVDLGMYYEQVKRYLNVFGGDNVKILLFEDLAKRPHAVIKEVFQFLGIDNNFTPTIKKHNAYRRSRWKLWPVAKRNICFSNTLRFIVPEFIKTKMRSLLFINGEKPVMDQRTKNFLIDFYRKDVSRLSLLIKRDMEHWCRISD